MTWPTKTDFVDGDVLTAAQVNNIGTNLNEIDPTGITDGYVVTADGAGGLGWEALPAAGGMTQIASGTFASAAVTISSISTTYKDLVLILNNISATGNGPVTLDITSATFYNKQVGSNGANSVSGYSYQSGANAYWALLPAQAPGASKTNGQYYVHFPNYAASGNKFAYATYFCEDASSNWQGGLFTCWINLSAAIDNLTISGEGVTLDAGTYKLFGVS